MVRNIAGVVVGLFVGSVANMALIFANMALFPAPPDLDIMDPEAFAAYAAGLPDTAFILPMVAHLAQAFIGGWVAARIGASRPVLLALIVGVLSLVGGVLNMMNFPDAPIWMWAEMPGYLAVAWAAGTLEQRRRAGQQT